MTSAHIEIPSTNRHNQAVRSAVSGLTEAIATLKKLKPVLEQAALGNDYAALAILLGLSGTTEKVEADAELTINYVTNVIAELEADTDVQAFISRFG